MSCYCWSWCSLHRRTNAGIVWVSAPGDYATFNSNHTPDGTMMPLADRLAVTRNRPTGFDWMRLLLATSIILWHTLALSYGEAGERPYLVSPLWRPPVVALLGMFFCLSGFLVAG